MKKTRRVLSFLLAMIMVLMPVAEMTVYAKSGLDQVEIQEFLDSEEEDLEELEGESINESEELEEEYDQKMLKADYELETRDLYDSEEVDELEDETPFKYEAVEDGIIITGYEDGLAPANLVIPKEIDGRPVVSIGKDAFRVSEFGNTFIKDPTIESLEIPASVKSIEDGAFWNQEKMVELKLVDGIEKIGERSFSNTGLENLSIPGTVKEISGWAFEKTGLKELIFEEGNDDLSISRNAFGNNNLLKVNLPNRIKGFPEEYAIFNGNKDDSGELRLVEIYTDNELATGSNTFGLINPAKVEIKYLKDGKKVKESDEVVGRELYKFKKLSGSSNFELVEGDGEYIKDYKVPLNKVSLAKRMDEFKDNYYQIGKEYTFEAPEIDGIKPESQIVKLEKENEDIVFIYEEENSQDSEELEEIAKSLEWYKINNLDSDKDKNVIDILKSKLNSDGYKDIEVELLSVENKDDKTFVSDNGKINYFFIHPSEQKFKIIPKHSDCKFKLTKGTASKEVDIRVTNGKWDKDNFRKVIEEDIIDSLDRYILGDNIAFDNFKKDVELKSKIGSRGYDYLEIKLESDNKALVVDEGGNSEYIDGKTQLKPHKLLVKPVEKRTEVNLKARLVSVQGEEAIYEKNYKLTLIPDGEISGSLEEKMQDLLDANYTEDKLRDCVTGEKLNFDAVTNDIKIPRPKDIGIENYDDYKYFVTSDNTDVIKPFEIKNTGRVVVYRPLPGEDFVEVTLTANMEDKKTGTTVSKELEKIKVLPLTEEEINEEIQLMEEVKKNYFELIKGENESKDKITKDLKWFSEVNLINSELVWSTDIKDDLNHGIVPDDLDGWYESQKWRIFRSSNPNIITHENLLVTRPEVDTKVKIDSVLSSRVYGKYAEKYPNDSRFKALYKQPVSVEVTVLANNKLNDEIEFLVDVYKEKLKKKSESNYLMSKQEVGAAKLAGLDIKDIRNSIYMNDNKTAYQLAQSIVTLICADMDPRVYNDKGKVRNLVKELEDMQMETGEFASNEREKTNLLYQLRSIIALDMAGGNYDEEKAIERAIDVFNRRGEKVVLNNKLIEAEGIMLTALSNHRDKDNVEETINNIYKVLKENQNEQAGFNMRNASSEGKNTPLAIARVIQGLVANGIDPLTNEEWIKNGNTMLDAMVKSKVIGNDLDSSGYSRGEGDSGAYGEATGLAFAALIDLKNQESMFHKLALKTGADLKPSKIEIINKPVKELEVNDEIILETRVLDEKGNIISGSELEWITDDEEVATVDESKLLAKGVGKTNIKVRIKDSNIEDNIEVEVVEEIKEIEIKTAVVYYKEDGSWDIVTNPSTIKLGKDESGRFTVFGALKETTDNFKGDSGWIHEINGIKGPKDSGGWTFMINDHMGNDLAGEAILRDGDTLHWVCTYDWKKNPKLSWQDILDRAGIKEEYSIKVLNEEKNFKAGEEVALDIKITKDGKLVDKDYIILIRDGSLAEIKDANIIKFNSPGRVKITVALKDNKDISTNIEFNILDGDKISTIDRVLEDLREHYLKKEKWTPREVIGYNHSSIDIEKDIELIGNKRELRDNSSVANISLNIISLIASGENPYKFNDINYVKLLQDSQKPNGKFIIKSNDDYITTQAFAVIAMDMAGASYDKDSAVKMLLEDQKANGAFTEWDDIDSVGMVLSALSNHLDRSDVKEALPKSIDFIAKNWKSSNQFSLSAGIQGLVAVGKNLEDDRFDGIVDRLLSYYTEDRLFGKDMANEQAFIALADAYKGESMFRKIRYNNKDISSIEIINPSRELYENDFMQLKVLARDEDGNLLSSPEIEWSIDRKDLASIDESGKISSFKAGKITVSAKVKDKDIFTSIELDIKERVFSIEYLGDMDIKNGIEASGRVKIFNKTNNDESATLIIGLYDEATNNLVNYSMMTQVINGGESVELGAGFLVPKKGSFYSKVFVWDSLDSQNILLDDAIDLKLAQ